MSETHEPVAIVGAGLACDIHLHEAGVPVRVWRAALAVAAALGIAQETSARGRP
jgi:hypothetical protein